MDAKIVSYRKGRHTQTDNQMILSIPGVSTKEDAGKYVGKTVTFATTSGKLINGKISAVHGNSGAVRAHFERGMPGQSLSSSVKIA